MEVMRRRVRPKDVLLQTAPRVAREEERWKKSVIEGMVEARMVEVWEPKPRDRL